MKRRYITGGIAIALFFVALFYISPQFRYDITETANGIKEAQEQALNDRAVQNISNIELNSSESVEVTVKGIIDRKGGNLAQSLNRIETENGNYLIGKGSCSAAEFEQYNEKTIKASYQKGEVCNCMSEGVGLVEDESIGTVVAEECESDENRAGDYCKTGSRESKRYLLCNKVKE